VATRFQSLYPLCRRISTRGSGAAESCAGRQSPPATCSSDPGRAHALLNTDEKRSARWRSPHRGRWQRQGASGPSKLWRCLDAHSLRPQRPGCSGVAGSLKQGRQCSRGMSRRGRRLGRRCRWFWSFAAMWGGPSRRTPSAEGGVVSGRWRWRRAAGHESERWRGGARMRSNR